MNKDEQRIAIAEACGWKSSHGKWVNWMWAPGHITNAEAKWENETGGFLMELPDYLNDLNAAHEMEKVLSEDQNLKYRDVLCSVVANQTPFGQRWFYWWNATAAQRAEAFLRAIGKWKE